MTAAGAAAGVRPLVTLPAHEATNLVAGPDGNLWLGVSSTGAAAAVERISPGGAVASFPIPAGPSAVKVDVNSLTTGPDGNIWFTADVFSGTNFFDGTQQVVIGKVTPAGQVTEFPPISTPGDEVAFIGQIVAGPEGDLWFGYNLGSDPLPGGKPGSETGQNFIGQISPAGALTLHPITAPGTPLAETGLGPTVLDGADGNLWFSQGTGRELGRMTPAGVVTLFPVDDFSVANVVNGTAGTFLVDGIKGQDFNQLVVVDTAGGTRPYHLPKTRTFESYLPLGTAAGALAFQADDGAPSLVLSPKSGTARTINLATPTKAKFPSGWTESVATGQDGNTYLAALSPDGPGGASTVSVYRLTPGQLAGRATGKVHPKR